jgi:shikimate kinase
MQPVRIFLIGLPGSGKTTLGRRLGRRLGLEFLDLDKEIELAEGRTIPEIFADSGEDHFRSAESGQLRMLLESTRSYVLACGGGTPCFHDNMNAMKSSGLTIYLDAPLEVIHKRLSRTATGRPLLQGADAMALTEKIDELDRMRRGIYQQAELILTGVQEADHLAEAVRAVLKEDQ